LQSQYSLYSIFSPNAWEMLNQNQRNFVKQHSTIIDNSNNSNLYNTSLGDTKVVIASITKNSVSKLSLAIADNNALSWVLKALEENIRIHCVNINNLIKNPNLKRIIDRNIEILRNLGLEFLSLTDITNLLLHNNKSHYTAKQTHQQNKHSLTSVKSEGPRVITERDVKSMDNNQQLIINQGDIITPLAKDLIKSKKITILKQENNSKR
jgi:hypothetical protein